MGRKKIKLCRIRCLKERCSKFSKRKKGILKKVEEISMLCDVDIFMLLFSPRDKPEYFLPCSRPLSKILERLSKISLQDREERRVYTIKTLKKAYKNNNKCQKENRHPSSERDEVFEEEDKVDELRKARKLLEEKISILGDWRNPYGIDDLTRLNIMEKYLVSSLSQIREIKMHEDHQRKYNSAD